MYIRVFTFLLARILNMLKVKCDMNQQDLLKIELHLIKSE